MHKYGYLIYALVCALFACPALAAPIWQDMSAGGARGADETSWRQFRADDTALRSALARAPHEDSLDRSQRIELPLPDGRVKSYIIVESPVMEDGLAARFPEIRSYRVFDPASKRPRGRLSLSPRGFRGMLRTDKGRVFIDPADSKTRDQVYTSQRPTRGLGGSFRCEVHDQHRDLESWLGPKMRSASRVEGSLLQYRLAVAVTQDYYDYFGADDAAVTSAINDTITRVNEIYETDLGIRLKLVKNNDELYDSNGQGLSGDNASTLLPQLNSWIDTRLPGGNSAYDLGHLFFIPGFNGGGGLAFLGSVCDDSRKGGGVTGLGNPLDDPFDVDYVAHEIGHQFDAEHSFNGTTRTCGPGRWAPSAYEPGSGVTIMGYAGLCEDENLQIPGGSSGATLPAFHAGSIAEINRFTRGGGNCYQLKNVNNEDPKIRALSNDKIPADTPFVLDVDKNVTDPDPGDSASLLFQWDQMDAGCPTDAGTFGTDNGSNPLFRSYLPRAETWRNFPALGTQLKGKYDKAEVLPCQDRELNFRLTARDGNSGQDFEDLSLTVVKSAGPFRITNLKKPQTRPAAGFQVKWDVAGTDKQPINCANVDIDLLTFSNAKYRRHSLHRLATKVANDGSANVVVPGDAQHPLARVRVKCSNSVFYALSAADLVITGLGAVLDDSDFETYSSANKSLVSGNAPRCRAPVDCGLDAESESTSSGGSGSTAVDLPWLLALVSLVGLVRLGRRYSRH